MLNILIALLTAAQAPATGRIQAPAPAVRLIVVFPFENTSEDRSLYWASEAIADGLSREIRQAGGTVVDRGDRISVGEDLGVPALSTLTLASQIRAAEELGASTLVTGTLTTKNGVLTANARLVDVPAGRIGSWLPVTGSANEIYAFQRGLYLALQRAGLPSSSGSGERPRPDTGAPEDGAPQAAYEFLLKSFFEDGLKKKEILLRHALELAPDYLRAQLELAQVYRDSGQIDKAGGALSRIVTRNRQLAAEAQNLLAEIEIERGHPQAAESALRSSLASLETARAHLLFARIAISREDHSLARSELDRARALDPDDPELADAEQALEASKE